MAASASEHIPTDDAQPRRLRRPRGSVSPNDMIDGAFELAEEIGLTKLSMPQLARHLGVPVTTIYWHFRRREQLLDAMVNRASNQYHFGTPFIGDDRWDDALRNHFRTMRQVFAANPVLCDLILLRTNQYGYETSAAILQSLETAVKKLVDAGFTAENALEVYLALSIHSRGSAILEHLNAQQNSGEDDPAAAGVLQLARTAGLSPRTPLLLELAGRGHTVSDFNFEFTLDAIIDRAKTVLKLDKARARADRKAQS